MKSLFIKVIGYLGFIGVIVSLILRLFSYKNLSELMDISMVLLIINIYFTDKSKNSNKNTIEKALCICAILLWIVLLIIGYF